GWCCLGRCLRGCHDCPPLPHSKARNRTSYLLRSGCTPLLARLSVSDGSSPKRSRYLFAKLPFPRNPHPDATEVTDVSGVGFESLSLARCKRMSLASAIGEQPRLCWKVANRLRALVSVAEASASMVMG